MEMQQTSNQYQYLKTYTINYSKRIIKFKFRSKKYDWLLKWLRWDY